MTTSAEPHRAFGRRRERHRITITGGGRDLSFEVDLRHLAGLVVAGALFGVVLTGSAGYLAFRDDLLTGSITRQIHQARSYEDRIAALRAEVDRINGRRLLDQDAFETKVDQLIERQQKLGEIQTRIGRLLDKANQAGLEPAKATRAGLRPPEATGSVAPAATVPAAPAAVAPQTPPPLDTDRFAAPLRTSWLSRIVAPAEAAAPSRDPVERVAAAERGVVAFEARQTATLDHIADAAETRAERIDRVLSRLGFRVAEAPQPRPRPSDAGPATTGAAMGGPFVPAAGAELAAARAEQALTRLSLVRRAALALPVRRPLPGNPAVTSGYGARNDPFLGVAAMHTGIDFRAETGEPIHATAPGTVTVSGRQGGYGLCVDIDHGNGVVTRYGHMSQLALAVGDPVKAGDVVGYAGSTGRSTGPHLHYETRVGGEPVDPEPWLEAGRDLGL